MHDYKLKLDGKTLATLTSEEPMYPWTAMLLMLWEAGVKGKEMHPEDSKDYDDAIQMINDLIKTTTYNVSNS